MTTPIVLSSLSKREAIIDAVYRGVLGLDTNDVALFKSAWVQEQDITFDLNGAVITGWDAIDENVMRLVGPMDTTHTITNVRVDVKDGVDTAVATTHATAQHFRPGEGGDPASKGLLAGALYNVDLVEDKKDGLWKVKHWAVKVVWFDGDMSILAH